MRGKGSNRNIFSTIYRTNHWGSSESLSGPGSELRQTRAVRAALPTLLKNLHVRTMLDLGCGDFNWMQKVDLHFLKLYTGIDVVPAVIRRNTAGYGSQTRKFICLDAVKKNLPKADLVFSRDCFVHLQHTQIATIIQRIKKSGATYFLTTTYPQVSRNADTVNGKWRPINLTKQPFLFLPPRVFIPTGFTDRGRHFPGNGLGLWFVEDLDTDRLNKRVTS